MIRGNLNKWKKKAKKSISNNKEGKHSRRWNEVIANKNKWEYEEEKVIIRRKRSNNMKKRINNKEEKKNK